MTLDTNTALVIGARGYNHRAWCGHFYPPDLPSEWRYLFYSHRQGALLMPARTWYGHSSVLAQWHDEAPPAFRLILELPLRALTDGFMPAPSPLVAGYVLRAPSLSIDDLPVMAAWAGVAAISVDLARGRARLGPTLAAMQVGLCGRSGPGQAATGPLALTLVGGVDRRVLGRVLRALLDTPAPQGRALFFYRAASALGQITDAQLLVSVLVRG
ncbi:MAG: hypothetical protein ACYCXG_02690 [Acidiferrobacter sp.]